MAALRDHPSEHGRGQRGLDLTCLIEERLRLDRFSATAVRNFLPLSAAPPFRAEQESRSRPPSTLFRPDKPPIAQAQWGPRGCGPIVSDQFDSHRGRDGRAPINPKGSRKWQSSANSPPTATPSSATCAL
ncbi:conserved hypothetical protein [Agrobacterium deltaense Zutra 3/1]|uniref:Uncharacterized protein n=1 Tax=Agrobacterium deltaense Zutra 3/1 TaxID=1183427 RepID=A0A1S7S206_9HYPH|nr:conserved hypothetical protein [Agrobacterium deltaense Zutra 3/1]